MEIGRVSKMGKFENFMAYRFLYARGSEDSDKYPRDDVSEEQILTPWKEAKGQYLFKLFGGEDNLILERPICYERGADQTRREFNEWIDDSEEARAFIYTFRERFARYLDLDIHQSWRWSRYGLEEYGNDGADLNEEERDRVLREQFMEWVVYATGVDYLMENALPLEKDLRIKDRHTGKMLAISRGEKVMRMLGKFAKLVHMENEFEQFRLGHSRVLNTNKLKGTMCLSIHPLDYATASDNANGWNSCMSWQDCGCYRMGTVEMMNSPMVICCYLKSAQNNISFRYNHTDYEWNSKKWRAWAILDEHQCLVNRQYPYDNDALVSFCLNWIRELAAERLGWDFDDEERIYGENPDHHSGSWIRDDYLLQYETVHMYNDVNINGEGNLGMLRKNFAKLFTKGKIHIPFSGVAECMCCGAIIEEKDHADSLFGVCCDEDSTTRCTCCGDRIYDGDIFWGPDDEAYCESCYNDHFTHCNGCDEDVSVDDTMQFELDWDEDLIERTIKDNPYHVSADTIETWKHGARWGWRNLCADSITLCGACRRNFGITNASTLPGHPRWDRHLIMNSIKEDQIDDFLSNCDISYFRAPNYRTTERLAAGNERELEDEAVRNTWRHIWKWSGIKQEAERNKED